MADEGQGGSARRGRRQGGRAPAAGCSNLLGRRTDRMEGDTMMSSLENLSTRLLACAGGEARARGREGEGGGGTEREQAKARRARWWEP